MSELSLRMAEARDRIQVDWSAERADRNRRAIQHRWRRRAGARAAGRAGALVFLVVALGLAMQRFPLHRGPRPAGHPAGPSLAADPQPLRPVTSKVEAPLSRAGGRSLRFRDGSVATPLTGESRLSAQEDVPGRTLVQLAEGGARFDVVHDPARIFRVDAGDAAVEVLGTRFTVERLGDSGRRVRVAVEHGRVRVLWDGGYAELSDGQSDEFPQQREAPRGHLPQRRHDRPVNSRGADWKELAQEGRFEQAYGTLGTLAPGPLSEISDEPGDLLILADVARLSHHPAQAVSPLRKVVREHPGDPRAPLAAFTLGRVLLDELGRPEEAAEAFQQAQALDPAGPMAQDALAREVEAWSRAGDVGRARERAEVYVQRYPDGRRMRTVRRYGGLE